MFEQYLRKIKEHPWLTYATLSVLFFLYVLFCHIIPLCIEITDINRTIKTNIQKIAQFQDYHISSTKLKKRKKQIEYQIKQLVYTQSQDTHLSSIITFLSKTAKDKRVNIAAIKPQPVEKIKNHIEYPIELLMTASFHQLGKFINAIETSKMIIKVKSLKVLTGKMSSNKLDIEITLVVYYLT